MTTATQHLASVNNRRLALFPWLLPAAALWTLVPSLSPLRQMCGIALTLFLLIKLHTLLQYFSRGGTRPSRTEILAWFAAWPGLDAAAFFRRSPAAPAEASVRTWMVTAGITSIGFLLWTVGAPRLLAMNEQLAGWIALTGIALSLHFGLFRLLALFWRSQDRPVVPIMNHPAAATSLSDFWNRRWNLAFRDYAHFAVFLPLVRCLNPSAALFIGCLFSGLIHELAISFPAGGGYGLPTLYFGIQGLGILLEHHLRRHRSVSSPPLLGRLWTALITIAPVWLLFHQPFIQRVVIPLISSDVETW